MREIKFRAWNKDNNEYIYDYQDKTIFESYGFYSHEEYIYEQYTGLKDKNGKDIYEGDIICNKTVVRVFDCRNGKYMYHNDTVETLDVVVWDHHWASFSFTTRIAIGVFEIIGNIHENKELLK